jgi:hypothetical protein
VFSVFLALGLTAAAVNLESAIRDVSVSCADPATDLDGDGAPDVACITRRGDRDPQRVVVVLSSAPGRLLLDAPVLGCPACGGALGLSVGITMVGATVEVEERGGSREEWTRGLHLAHAAGGFRLAEEFYVVRDRVSGSEVQAGTRYEQGIAESKRILTPAGGAENASTSWLDLYAEAVGSEPDPSSLRPRIGQTVVDSADFLVAGAAAWSGPDDLSFTVRAQSAGPDVRLGIEVKDDDVQPGARPRADRVEVWWDRGGDPWTADFQAKLRPVARTTTGVSLRLLPAGKLGVTQLFPPNGDQPGLVGSWKRTPSGYAVDVRAARRLLTGALERPDRQTGETLVNATIVVRDADTGDAEEAALSTSSLEHRGAPFEMGLLHLPPAGARPAPR